MHLKTRAFLDLRIPFIACGADYIITNDKDWRKVEEIQVLMVGDL